MRTPRLAGLGLVLTATLAVAAVGCDNDVAAPSASPPAAAGTASLGAAEPAAVSAQWWRKLAANVGAADSSTGSGRSGSRSRLV